MKKVLFIDNHGVSFKLYAENGSIILETIYEDQSMAFELKKSMVREVIHELVRLKDEGNG